MPRQRAKERSCEYAIKKTLAYSSIFDYPLSFFQLSNYLLTNKSYDYDFIRKTLRRLIKNKSVQTSENNFYLPSVRPISKTKRIKHTKKLLEENNILFESLIKIPWVKMIAISGSVAAYNTDKDSDIDIFVITAKNRLWISRGLLVLIIKILGKYPHGDTQPGKICPNLLIDFSAMQWPKDKRNIYTAREIAMLQPIFQKNNIYFDFLKENTWVFSYLSNFKINFEKDKNTDRGRNTKEKSKIVNIIENFAYKMQLNYMKNKITTETIQKHIIHLKKHDNSSTILEKYHAIIKNIS